MSDRGTSRRSVLKATDSIGTGDGWAVVMSGSGARVSLPLPPWDREALYGKGDCCWFEGAAYEAKLVNIGTAPRRLSGAPRSHVWGQL